MAVSHNNFSVTGSGNFGILPSRRRMSQETSRSTQALTGVGYMSPAFRIGSHQPTVHSNTSGYDLSVDRLISMEPTAASDVKTFLKVIPTATATGTI